MPAPPTNPRAIATGHTAMPGDPRALALLTHTLAPIASARVGDLVGLGSTLTLAPDGGAGEQCHVGLEIGAPPGPNGEDLALTRLAGARHAGRHECALRVLRFVAQGAAMPQALAALWPEGPPRRMRATFLMTLSGMLVLPTTRCAVRAAVLVAHDVSAHQRRRDIAALTRTIARLRGSHAATPTFLTRPS